MKLQKTISTTSTEMSPQQKKFIRLSKKIDQENQNLEQWLQAQKDIQEKASREILPAYEQLRQIIYQQIESLVLQKSQKMTAIQLDKLDEKIEKLAFQLLQSGQMSEQQVNYLMDLLREQGHNIVIQEGLMTSDTIIDDGDDIEQEFQQQYFDELNDNDEDISAVEIEQLKIYLMHEYDLEPDFFDFEADTQEEFLQIFAKKMQQREFESFASQMNKNEREFFENMYENEMKQQDKLKEKRENARKIASKSMKEIYLKITAMIHPDREQNSEKKQEKTILFQKVNQAHEEQDLFKLLAVQAELGQIEHKVANEQLKAYNILLEERLENIELEIEELIESFDWDSYFGGFFNRKIKVQDLHKKYQQDWKAVQDKISSARQRLEQYQDIKSLKLLMRSAYIWEMN